MDLTHIRTLLAAEGISVETVREYVLYQRIGPGPFGPDDVHECWRTYVTAPEWVAEAAIIRAAFDDTAVAPPRA